MVFPDVENHILENNLYGVDINEESVEIARLSLWLRTAQKGRKLTSLSENIKVGNSLIDDPAVAGELAFNWQMEFPQVFKKGGFDAVIGNPPYVSHERVMFKSFLSKSYESHQGFTDLFTYFFELGLNVTKPNGYLSFITSNSFLRADYGSPLRMLLRKRSKILAVIDIGKAQIFSEAIVSSSIMILRNRKSLPEEKCEIVSQDYIIGDDFYSYVSKNRFYYSQSDFDDLPWNLIDPGVLKLRKKIRSKNKTLEELGAKIRLGIATGSNEAFLISTATKNELIAKDINSKDLIKPILRGKDISRYSYKIPDLWLLLTKNGIDVPADYPAVYEHLDSFGEKFRSRGAKGQHWTNLRACSFFDDFKKAKIVWIELSDKGKFSFCGDEIYLLNSAYFMISPEGMMDHYLLSLLNSSLIEFYFKQIANTSGMGTSRWINIYVKELPVVVAKKNIQNDFSEKAQKIQLNIKLKSEIIERFLNLMSSKYFKEGKTSKKLQNWPSLDFKGFLAELKKKKVKLSLEEEAEWMTYFNKKKEEAQALQSEINRLDNEIDQMVYELYGLTDDEIAIVEESVAG